MVRLTGPSSGPLSPLSGSGLPLALSEQGTAVELSTTERVIKRDQFIFSLPYFFRKTTVELTDRRLVFERPNTMLGVIPIGKQKDTLPIGITPSIVFGRSKTSRRSVNSTVVLRKKNGSEKMN